MASNGRARHIREDITKPSGGIALVTGGSRGPGKDTIKRLVGRGTDVIFTYRSNESAAEAVAAGIRATGRRAVALQLDVGDSGTFAGRSRFLVNNAGVGANDRIAETTEAQFDRLIEVHVKGPLFPTQKLLPLMEDGERVVNVSSALTRAGVTYPGQAVYASAKDSVEVMTKYPAAELGPRGITANVVSPGGIATDFFGGAMHDPYLQEMAASVTALGREGQPGAVGGAVASLLSSEMGLVNGRRVEVSGGQNL